ncbi:PREDICTED: uncharacterized protein LOC108560976 [Nicrophorus vespilloides]|uniref:Uncharacterized protein LOC108560976 n=1 Tax=Nicrophorus vespilloides TaxID=110193 RepID=A0ABM1MI04_NICVS|nr:PREDICTED: uncharacterized protein LOC108560976 [Nicrophorus vespilloides]
MRRLLPSPDFVCPINRMAILYLFEPCSARRTYTQTALLLIETSAATINANQDFFANPQKPDIKKACLVRLGLNCTPFGSKSSNRNKIFLHSRVCKVSNQFSIKYQNHKT